MSQPERAPILEIEAGAKPLSRLASGQARRQLETEVLPSWLTGRRRYAANDAGRPEVRITEATSFDGDARAVLAELTATPPGQASHFSMSERRAKHCPLKDVAGMLRSFAYAGAAAAKAAKGDDAVARARALADEMGDVFLARYREASDGCLSWPVDPEDAHRLLRLFVLVLEVRYEAANRPDWLATPIEGVIALLDVPSASRSGPPFLSENRSVRR